MFSELKSAPNATKYPFALRWYNTTKFALDNNHSLPGEAKAASAYGPVAAAESKPAADEDDIDLFGSDDEEVDEAAEKLRQQRLAEYAAKKANKPGPIAKSLITLDVKPWDDETDMDAMLVCVKSVVMDGLVWGSHKFVPVGYGIRKLQINCVVEDEKVSTDDLQQQIEAFEDHVQSTDVAAMAKV